MPRPKTSEKNPDLMPGTRIKTLTGRLGTVSQCPAASDMAEHYYFVRLDEAQDGNSLDRWVAKIALVAIGGSSDANS